MDLDPSSEVLAVYLKRLARPSPSGETGDLARRDASESKHHREYSGELIAASLLGSVKYPVSDVTISIESIDPA